MSTTTKQIERKLRVCASRQCSRCELVRKLVPEDCEYGLKHVLDSEPERIVINQGRRTGKTRAVVRRAAEMVEAGYEAIIMVPTSDEAHRLQRALMGTGIEILVVGRSKSAVWKALAGKKSSTVFSDEVGEWVADEVNRMPHHSFVVGYRT